MKTEQANKSGIIDLRGRSQLTILVKVVNTTDATAGAAEIMWQRYDRDGVAIGDEYTIASLALLHNGTGNFAVTVIAHGLAEEASVDAAEATNTIGTDFEHIFPLGRGKLNINVSTACDATVSTGNVRLFAQ